MDAHTHRFQETPHIYVLSSKDLLETSLRSPCFCAGVHPWHVARGGFERVQWWAQQKGCVAIGETGLDRLHPLWEQQLASLKQHWDLAETLNKPLVLHVVRSSSDIMQLLKARRPKTPWVWHDFTGPIDALARLLKLHPALYFSCGLRLLQRPNFVEIWGKIPPERRLLETDDAGVSIQEVYKRAGVTETELKPNFQRLFPQLIV
jgi:TatD DNase family protein